MRVETENPRTGECRHTNTAYLTMVALDEESRPTAVPALAPGGPVEERRAREAEVRRRNRLAERREIRRPPRRGLSVPVFLVPDGVACLKAAR